MNKILEILQNSDHDNIRIYIINKSTISNFGNNSNYDLTNDNNYKNMIISKLKDIANIKNIEYKIKREYYYSQIRDIDIDRKREKCYVIEQKQLNTLKVNNIEFIINSFDLYTQDLQSFPDLHKYHNVTNIEKIEYIFNNIKLIFENNNIIIDLKKKYDLNDLTQIFDFII
jgi:hypothetical protein